MIDGSLRIRELVAGAKNLPEDIINGEKCKIISMGQLRNGNYEYSTSLAVSSSGNLFIVDHTNKNKIGATLTKDRLEQDGITIEYVIEKVKEAVSES